MPKDPTRNVQRYKIEGGHLNEFEFHQNQAAIHDEQKDLNSGSPRLIPGTPPEVRARMLEQETKKIRGPLQKKSAKKPPKQSTKGAKKTSVKKVATKRVRAKKRLSKIVKKTTRRGRKK
jgi:hypothetical protein